MRHPLGFVGFATSLCIALLGMLPLLCAPAPLAAEDEKRPSVERTTIDDGYAASAILLAHQAGHSLCLSDVFSVGRDTTLIERSDAIAKALLDVATRGKELKKKAGAVVPPKYQSAPYRHEMSDVLLPLIVNSAFKLKVNKTGASRTDLVALTGLFLVQGYQDCKALLARGLAASSSDPDIEALLQYVNELHVYQRAVVAERLPAKTWAQGTPLRAQVSRVLAHPGLAWLKLEADVMTAKEEEPVRGKKARVQWMRELRTKKRPLPFDLQVSLPDFGPAIVAPLIRMLYDKDKVHAAGACEMFLQTLRHCRPVASHRLLSLAVPRLLVLAQASDSKVQRFPQTSVAHSAQMALAALSPIALPAVERALTSRDKKAVKAAIGVVRFMTPADTRAAGPEFDSVRAHVERYANGSDLLRAHAAVDALEASTGALYEVASDRRGGTYLGKPPRFWVKYLGSRDRHSRGIAINALVQIGEPAMREVRRQFSSREDAVRRDAADIVWRMRPTPRDVLEPLLNLLEDPNTQVRGQAAHALGRLGPAAHKGVQRLMELLSDENSVTAGAAAGALSAIGARAAPALPALKRRNGRDILERMFLEGAIKDIEAAVVLHEAALASSPLTAALYKPVADGLFIEHVRPQSAAAAAGLAVGDVIISYDGSPTPTMNHLIDAKARAERAASGEVPLIWIQPDGSRKEGRIKTGMMGTNLYPLRRGAPPLTLPSPDGDALKLLRKPLPDVDAWLSDSVVISGKRRAGVTHWVRTTEEGECRQRVERTWESADGGARQTTTFDGRLRIGEDGRIRSYTGVWKEPTRTGGLQVRLVEADGGEPRLEIKSHEGDRKPEEATSPLPSSEAVIPSDYEAALAVRLERKDGSCVHFRPIRVYPPGLAPPTALWCRGPERYRHEGTLVRAWRVERHEAGYGLTRIYWIDAAGAVLRMDSVGAVAHRTTAEKARAFLSKR